jgi:signal transduction histidine kinase
MRKLFLCSVAFILFAHFTAFCMAPAISPDTSSIQKIDSLIARGHPLVKKDVSRAMVLFANVESLSSQVNYTRGLAEAYLAEAEIFSQRGYVKRALDLYDLSLELSRKNNDWYHIALAEEHMSVIHKRNKNLKEADRLLAHALQIFRKLGKQREVIDVELRQCVVSIAEGKFDAAAAIGQSTLALCKKTHYQFGEKKCYYNKGFLFDALNKPDSAVFYFNKCLKIDTLTNDSYGRALSLRQLSLIYEKSGKPAKALYYAQEAYKYAEQVKALELMSASAEVLLDASRKSGNSAAIIKWQDKLLAVDKQIHEQDKSDAIAFIETLKQEQHRQLLQQQKVARVEKISQIKSFFILVFIVTGAVAVAFWIPLKYNYKRARKYAELLQEKNKLIEQHSEEVEILNQHVTAQNDKLGADNKLKDKLLSVISHDLRHPLANTKSILDLINLKLVSFDEAEQLFAQLEAQYVRSITLLDNLLFWIKGQMEGVEARKADVSVFSLVEILADEQRMPLVKKKIKVVNDIDPSVAWHAEKESIKIIFRNLLSNAVKFTNKDGQIVFSSLITARGEAVIKVKDNGVGMDEETLDKINRQLHYTSKGTANEEGSGLGLMLIRDLIKKFDGTLQVKSTRGQGSEFIVTFNAAVVQPAVIA